MSRNDPKSKWVCDAPMTADVIKSRGTISLKAGSEIYGTNVMDVFEKRFTRTISLCPPIVSVEIIKFRLKEHDLKYITRLSE